MSSTRLRSMPVYSRFWNGLSASRTTYGRPLMYSTGSSRMLCHSTFLAPAAAVHRAWGSGASAFHSYTACGCLRRLTIRESHRRAVSVGSTRLALACCCTCAAA